MKVSGYVCLWLCLFCSACKTEQQSSVPQQALSLSKSEAAAGDTITVTLTNELAESTKPSVKIGNKNAQILSVQKNLIKIIVPKDAETGNVSVTQDGISTLTLTPLVVYNVYIAGTEAGIVKYWKNGVATSLTSNNNPAQAFDIEVVSPNRVLTDVYVAGYEYNAATGRGVAKYWKNGVATFLTNGTQNAEAHDIEVVGSDIYVAGYEGYTAKYWKNGIAVNITNGTYPSSLQKILVSGTDVYVAGSERIAGKVFARIWKNGVVISSSQGWDDYAFVTGLAFDGTNVYGGGFGEPNNKQSTALQWKNGVETVTSNNGYSQIWGLSIVRQPLAGGGYYYDTYAVGEDGLSFLDDDYYHKRKATYWLNGVPTYLTDSYNEATAYDIAIYSGNVVAVGYEENATDISIAKYWKNGTAYSLTDGTKSAEARAVTVSIY
jgi:hypothetical protein